MKTNIIPMPAPQLTSNRYVNAFVQYVRKNNYPDMFDEDYRFECDHDNASCERLSPDLEGDQERLMRLVTNAQDIKSFDGGVYLEMSNGYDSLYILAFDGVYYTFSGGLNNE